MDVKYNKFYQLGNGGDLIFERDLDQLLELLERPHPEFFGAQLNDQGGEDLQGLIVASLLGNIEPPTAEGIQFTLRENNWLDGLARAMQEALARLCGQSINQIKGTRFEFCPRRDAMGQPLEAPYHHELKTQLDHLSFMMYDRQQELDNCRDYSNHKSAIIKTKDQTIAMLEKDRKSRRHQLDKKERIIARLRHRISDLEETIHERDMQLAERENAGLDLRGDPYFYLSDDDDFLEDQAMDFFTDEDDYAFINDDEDDEATDSEE